VRSPQIVVYESERWIAELLHGTAEVWQWPLRELRDADDILRALRAGGPSVLVVEIGRDVAHDLALLDRLVWLCPDALTVAVINAASAELTGIAWDLGADYVLAPPQPRDALLAVVLGMMEATTAETAR
jgi:hypothetical protein